LNGKIIAQGSQFSLNDVEVVSATIDIEDVRSYRAVKSRSMQAAEAERYQRIEVSFALSNETFGRAPTSQIATRIHSPEEEIACVSFIMHEQAN
jgi:NAD+ synthase (glutamine-hydrolysing)